MKKLLCACAALAMTISAATALAADVTGTWIGEAPGPDGNSFQLTFTFKQDGAKLTGTVQGPQGEPLEISNGKIDGDKFSFDVSLNGITISHQCTVDGDQIKMITKTNNPDFPGMEMTLKRAKETAPAAPATPAAPAQPAQPPQ
jgi:hypothetical protein